MKMNFKYVMMACALTLGFASCSNNDDEVDNGGIIPNGEPTVALIKLSQVAGATTRGIEEAKDGEALVTGAVVYIFDAAAKFEQAVTLTENEAANTGKVITTTTGSHYFYAAVNAISGVPTTFNVGTPLETVKKEVLSGLVMADLTKATGFFMTNVSDALAQNIVASADGSDNDITINVGRAVAKVNVAVATDVEVVGEGTFTSMEYKIGGNPNQMYLFPVYESGTLRTPLYAADYLAANFLPLAAAYNIAGVPTYATENANAKVIKQGEATHALVKGVFTPKDKTPGADFWRVYNKTTGAWEAEFYAVKGDAVDAAATGPDTKVVVEYTGGVCHYAFWIADEKAADKYAINRNSYYNVEIQTVAKIGTNKPEGDEDIEGNPITDPINPPVNPEEPVETDTSLKVSINVLEWTVINTGVGI